MSTNLPHGATRYRVTHIIEATDGRGLNAYCAATPKVFTERDGYRVVSRQTEPETPTYMQPAIARHRHEVEGTAGDERVPYLFPVDCEGWLATLMMRQGYGVIPSDDGWLVVTSAEVDAWYLAQAVAETERASAEEVQA